MSALDWESATTTAAAVGAGIAGGVYFAFSALAIPALRTLDSTDAASAMRRVNELAVRAPFMTVFFGGAAAAAAVGVTEIASGAIAEHGPLRTIGAGLALVAFGITVARNVPLNTALAKGGSWEKFHRPWTRANTLRAAASIAAAIALGASSR